MVWAATEKWTRTVKSRSLPDAVPLSLKVVTCQRTEKSVADEATVILLGVPESTYLIGPLVGASPYIGESVTGSSISQIVP
jgi:hypothetical protein